MADGSYLIILINIIKSYGIFHTHDHNAILTHDENENSLQQKYIERNGSWIQIQFPRNLAHLQEYHQFGHTFDY